jgi:hypothetical protein
VAWLVQPNDHVALVARTVGPRLRVRRQSRFDRRIGFGGDRNADPGTASQRSLLHMSVGYRRPFMAIVALSRGEAKIALVLELCGGVCGTSDSST